MQAVVLADVRFGPDVDGLLSRLRIAPGDEDAATVERLAAEAADLGRPRGVYRVAYVEDREADSITVEGVTLRSRVLRVNLEGVYRVFPYVATCGRELDDWSDGLADTFERYWADTIKEGALRAALQAVEEHIRAHHEESGTASMSPGSLEDWPLTEQRPLFELVGDPTEAIGVELTDSYLMVPTKSVSGIRFVSEHGFQSCQLCPREGCPGRRAAYDEHLLRTKYAPPG
jgi:hypothetical protein